MASSDLVSCDNRRQVEDLLISITTHTPDFVFLSVFLLVFFFFFFCFSVCLFVVFMVGFCLGPFCCCSLLFCFVV